MAVDMFLKLDGIAGESKDDKHLNYIDVMSFSWGASQNIGSEGSGKVSMNDFHFVHRVDKATPLLLLSCAMGKHIPTGILQVRKGGDRPVQFLQYKLTDILVTSAQQGGHEAGGNIPTDQFSLNFSKVEVTYKFQKQDGSLVPTVVTMENPERNDF